MAPSLDTVFGVIPKYVLRPLKKWLKSDGVAIMDWGFWMSTKCFTAFIILLLCTSLTDKLNSKFAFNCTAGPEWETAISHTKTASNVVTREKLNEYCLNNHPFLVKKGLLTSNRYLVTSPGVMGMRGGDEIVKIRYVRHVWIAFVVLAALSGFPLLPWKVIARRKLAELIKPRKRREGKRSNTSGGDSSRTNERSKPVMENLASRRAKYFLDIRSQNFWFTFWYFLCKLMSLISPVLQWKFVQAFVSKEYKWYGLNHAEGLRSDEEIWPPVMDVVFPTHAKCSYKGFGYSGDVETVSALCDIPMNSIVSWAFLLLWWGQVIIISYGIMSFLPFLPPVFSRFRNWRWNRSVSMICEAQNDDKHSGQRLLLDYGDWLILYLMEKKLDEVEYIAFVRELMQKFLESKSVDYIHADIKLEQRTPYNAQVINECCKENRTEEFKSHKPKYTHGKRSVKQELDAEYLETQTFKDASKHRYVKREESVVQIETQDVDEVGRNDIADM